MTNLLNKDLYNLIMKFVDNPQRVMGVINCNTRHNDIGISGRIDMELLNNELKSVGYVFDFNPITNDIHLCKVDGCIEKQIDNCNKLLERDRDINFAIKCIYGKCGYEDAWKQFSSTDEMCKWYNNEQNDTQLKQTINENIDAYWDENAFIGVDVLFDDNTFTVKAYYNNQYGWGFKNRDIVLLKRKCKFTQDDVIEKLQVELEKAFTCLGL